MSDYEEELAKHIEWSGSQAKALRFSTHSYDANRAWDCVVGKVLKDTDWWLHQMGLPLLKDSSFRMFPLVEGDVPVQHAPGPSRPTAVADYTGHTGQVEQRVQRERERERERKQHVVSSLATRFAPRTRPGSTFALRV